MLVVSLRTLPDNLKGEKRPHQEADDVVEHTKRAKIANEPPSSLAQPRYFREWRRDPKECILDHRRDYNEPHGDTPDLPPISLQYEGFGHFLDIFRGRKGVPGMENVSSEKLQATVDDFAEQMSLIYPEEEDRRSIGLSMLNNIFSARTDNLSFGLMAATIDSKVRTDGHVLRPHHAAYCITEFKNELGSVSAIPYVELTSYFAHSTREATKYSFVSVMRGWNIPCLGITIVGMLYILFILHPQLTIIHCIRPLCHILCHDLLWSLADS